MATMPHRNSTKNARHPYACSCDCEWKLDLDDFPTNSPPSLFSGFGQRHAFHGQVSRRMNAPLDN